MEDIEPVQVKLKKKTKRSSMIKKKSSLMEDVVSQILPTLKNKKETVFLISEEKIIKSEQTAVKENKKTRHQNGNER
jgi:hypothetical protein